MRPSSLASSDCSALAREIERLSISEWGEERPTVLIGRHELLVDAISRVVRFAHSASPILITGETGTGKELFARAVFLNADHHRRAYLAVNCAQYCGTELVASELFGHRKGAFTGATADHRGIFEEADGGTVFLDEIGDLPMGAQAMLLRALSEGEVVPVGGTRAKRVNVRVVAATSRDLRPMMDAGKFRSDLYYRLRNLHVHIPPVRERGEDWKLIANHYLNAFSSHNETYKRFSDEALSLLRMHTWPGNVREVKSVVDTGFHLSDGPTIDVHDFVQSLEALTRQEQIDHLAAAIAQHICAEMVAGEQDFWEAVHRPFLDRELNRSQVREIVAEGLGLSRGSYKRLLTIFGIAPEGYLKFMDFLRHHDLKPAVEQIPAGKGYHPA